MSEEKMNRRSFLQTSTVLGVGTVVGASALLSACKGGNELVPLKQPGEFYVPELPDKAIDGRELKVGVVGCGGRGSGAVYDLLEAANGIKVVALGDVFADRLESLRENLKTKYNQEVPAENCFLGFDSYKQVIDSDIDMVILTTPPVFRPLHFQYATQKGKHSFLEKPIAVDAKGYRTIMASAKQAQAKNLSVITGTQRHHQRPYVEANKLIQAGYIGEITGGNVYWNQSMLWYRNREKGWSDMEWMIRDWVNWKWLSGDHIVEQHVHNIDVFLWMSGLKVAKKKKSVSKVDPEYLKKQKASLVRRHRQVIYLNDSEMAAIQQYCEKFRVGTKAVLFREAIMEKILSELEDNHPTLF